MNPTERVLLTLELAARTTARHLPKRVAYWSFVNTCERHLRPNETATTLPYTTILARFFDPPVPPPDTKPPWVPAGGTITWKAQP